MAGRKRLPQKVKEAKGTIRWCRENENEPDYVLARQMPDPPDYLDKTGRDVYYSTAEELLKLGILTRISLPIFVMYCIEVARYYECQTKIAKEGSRIKNRFDEWTINPLVKIANDARDAIIKTANEFGITPASASKVSAKAVTKDKKSELVERLTKR